jgi:hypothetical protein
LRFRCGLRRLCSLFGVGLFVNVRDREESDRLELTPWPTRKQARFCTRDLYVPVGGQTLLFWLEEL